jgi:DNA adenine methylase
MSITKPFLKWVGGKTQILEDVLATFPKEWKNYYEPFVGGGSVLLAALSLKKAGKLTIKGKVYASDLNENLIGLYKNVQANVEGLITEVKALKTDYEGCKGTTKNRKPTTLEEAKASPESYYYWIRSQFNAIPAAGKGSLQASAMFLFLNKTCFRGLYREGPNGFNVPFGNYKKPAILDEGHLREVNSLLQGVVFTTCSFKDALTPAGKGDFAYLDPPYAPETGTSFTSYTSEGFELDDHKALFKLSADLHAKGCKFAFSNADVQLVKAAFPAPVYTTKTIDCRRAINSKNPESKTKEVLITN